MSLDTKEQKELFDAAEKNKLETVKAFVEEKGASLLIVNDDLETLAHVAAKNGSTDVLKYVAQKEPSILADKDCYGNSIFYLANATGATDIVKYLIEEHAANISQANPRNFYVAAMQTAAEYGHLDILKYIVEQKNSDINVSNDRRETPVFTATEYKQHAIVKYLVEERGADLTMLDINHANILFATISTNDLQLMKYFLDERKVDIDVNWQDRFGNTILHRASIMNRFDIIKYLVEEKHADVNIAGHETKTPLHYAASRNYYAICKYLIEHGANTQSKDDLGEVPIQKTHDKRLIEYMRNVASATRSRRSVQLSYTHRERVQPRITNDLSLPANRLGGNTVTTIGQIYSSILQNYLVVADSVVGSAKRPPHRQRVKDATYISLSNVLQGKMDTVAVDAISSLPPFKE